MEKVDWKIKKEIGNIVLDAGGIIFGGYVRDSIIHDHYAKLYYENVKELDEIDTRYNDPTFYPEYGGRMLIPEDIDCFFYNSMHLKCFETLLLQHKFCVKRIFSRTNAADYLPRLNKLQFSLSHVRYKIFVANKNKIDLIKMLLLQNLPTSVRAELIENVDMFLEEFSSKLHDVPCVIIDALIANQEIHPLAKPPFGELDFECNGLIITKQGIALAEDLKEIEIANGFICDINKIAAVHGDILQKRAVIVQGKNVDGYRITKMKTKGWTIIHGDLKTIDKCNDIVTDQCTCIICHGGFTDKEAYKLPCCAAKYHSGCLLEAAQKGTAAMCDTKACIMCKQRIKDISNDITILKCMQD